MAKGGQFALANRGHFTLVLGGQFDWIFQDDVYTAQKKLILEGKYKVKKDNFTPWHTKLVEILDAFAYLVKDGVKDEF